MIEVLATTAEAMGEIVSETIEVAAETAGKTIEVAIDTLGESAELFQDGDNIVLSENPIDNMLGEMLENVDYIVLSENPIDNMLSEVLENIEVDASLPEQDVLDEFFGACDNIDLKTSQDVLRELENVSASVEGVEEPESRPLTPEEKAQYKEKIGCSDKTIDDATVDENGKLYIKTINSNKEGTVDENGVPYERKTVEINGVEIEGVFPKFESVHDVQLPEVLEKATNKAQFEECNMDLKEAIKNNPELEKQFTNEQLADIENGKTPRGYTWHHNEEQGKMQLVKSSDHNVAMGGSAHTGGQAIWCDGKRNR